MLRYLFYIALIILFSVFVFGMALSFFFSDMVYYFLKDKLGGTDTGWVILLLLSSIGCVFLFNWVALLIFFSKFIIKKKDIDEHSEQRNQK